MPDALIRMQVNYNRRVGKEILHAIFDVQTLNYYISPFLYLATILLILSEGFSKSLIEAS